MENETLINLGDGTNFEVLAFQQDGLDAAPEAGKREFSPWSLGGIDSLGPATLITLVKFVPTNCTRQM